MARRQSFGPYELAERIGVGALGEVFRAVRRADGKVVALKRLLASSESEHDLVETLEAEAKLLGALDHDAIAKLDQFGEASGVHFIAYEFVDGRDLRAVQERALRGDGKAPPARVPLDVALFVAIRIADALTHAHGRTDGKGAPLGLVHRDVSPPNIMVGFDGSVKLLDFGIARAAGRAEHTAAGQVKGTMGYMSPEQVQGDKIDARSDVYTLAVCLWELATGRRLFDGRRTFEVAAQIKKGEVPSARRVAARVSERLDAALAKALAQQPDQRYAGAREFRDELTALVRDEDLVADSTRVAQYVRSLFPEVAAESAASREEPQNMADDKGGSDLDVFEGLAKKSQRPASLPGLAPPASAPPRKATLVGGLAPVPLPPPGPTSKVPPPPGSLPSPSLPKPPVPSKPPPPPTPPSAKLGSTLPLSAPLPPPQRTSSAPALPAVSAPATKTPLPPPPTITPLPPPTPPSAGAPAASPSALPAPLPPPPAKANGPAKTQAQAAVDMDWDDEEESTHVYDKDGQPVPNANAGPRPAAGAPAAPKVGAAAALLASSGGAAAKIASALPPPPPVPAIPQPTAPPQRGGVDRDRDRDRDTRSRERERGREYDDRDRDDATSVRARSSQGAGSNRLGVIFGALSLLVAVAVAVFFFIPRKGQLSVDVKTKSGESPPKAEVFVDGKKVCDTVPCRVTDLEPGARAIKVEIPGMKPMDRTETVEGGKDKLVVMEVDTGAAAPASTGAATQPQASADATTAILKIAANSNQPQVKVTVDGEDKGALPLELKGIAPGAHKVKFDGGAFYEPQEQTIDVTAGQTKEVPQTKLKVVKGQVTLELATKGAEVKLVRKDGSKKVEKKLPESLWDSPPVRMELNPQENWKLVATKKGFDDFTQELSFDDGQAEKTISISLSDKHHDATPPPTPGPGPAHAPVETPSKPAPAAAEAGQATLNINSIPVSKVVLDGRPLGSTPKVGISVPAGSHTVTFIHPDMGKKTVTVTVRAGETKTAAVKF